MGWAALIVGLIVFAAFTPLMIGAFNPAILARGVIRETLAKHGIRSAISDACISELGDHTVATARLLARWEHQPWRVFLRKNAELTAQDVYAIVVGDEPFTAGEIKAGAATGTAHWVWQILAKHDPKRFALDNLEMLQSMNAILREAHYKDGRDGGEVR